MYKYALIKACSSVFPREPHMLFARLFRFMAKLNDAWARMHCRILKLCYSWFVPQVIRRCSCQHLVHMYPKTSHSSPLGMDELGMWECPKRLLQCSLKEQWCDISRCYVFQVDLRAKVSEHNHLWKFHASIFDYIFFNRIRSLQKTVTKMLPVSFL